MDDYTLHFNVLGVDVAMPLRLPQDIHGDVAYEVGAAIVKPIPNALYLYMEKHEPCPNASTK